MDGHQLRSCLKEEAKENVKECSVVINCDHGDPTIFEEYWEKMGANKCSSNITISGSQSLSYFSDPNNLCWFLEPELAQEIIKLHSIVGNAVTEDCHIIVGTGSTQLYQAALYALSSPESLSTNPIPINVVCQVPYYSCYPSVTDFLKSGLYKWAGDAAGYDKDEPYIEVVTSPNNPDGHIREPVVQRNISNGNGGKLIHDLAYYWPQYTAITSPADHDLTLFTLSKATGHAGTRIGWALVKDRAVAEKMKKYIELNTIGVSKESQLRAAKILRVMSQSCQNPAGSGKVFVENFFEFSRNRMIERWERLRAVVKQNGVFNLPEYPTNYCNFSKDFSEAHPAFAWLECRGKIEDCEGFLKKHKILTRSGKFFGASIKFTRVSLVDRKKTFDLLLERLSTLTEY